MLRIREWEFIQFLIDVCSLPGAVALLSITGALIISVGFLHFFVRNGH